jgi:hypothetical protein
MPFIRIFLNLKKIPYFHHWKIWKTYAPTTQKETVFNMAACFHLFSTDTHFQLLFPYLLIAYNVKFFQVNHYCNAAQF